MKKYDVCGLGNALTDVLVHLKDDSLFEKNGIEKGSMTLVNTAEWDRVYDLMGGASGAVMSGGSCANSVATCSLLGGKAVLQAKTGGDNFGAEYRRIYEGICPGSHLVTGDGASGKCLSLITPDAERTMRTDLGIANALHSDELDEEMIASASVLHLSGYLFTGGDIVEAAFRAMDIARQEKTRISLDVSDAFVIENFREAVDRAINDYADIVFANEVEVKSLYGDVDTARRALRDSCELGVMKFGGRGSELVTRDDTITIDVHPVTAVDTTGAGDSYAGAVLYGLTHGFPLEKTGALASRVAAAVVSQTGAVLDKADHLLREV